MNNKNCNKNILINWTVKEIKQHVSVSIPGITDTKNTLITVWYEIYDCKQTKCHETFK